MEQPTTNQPGETPEPTSTSEPAEASAPETAQAPARPVRRPPHEEEAPPEVLNERGQVTAGILLRVAAPYVVSSGGRDDLPWVEVRAEHLAEVARNCKEHHDLRMEMLHCLLAVDYSEHIQVVYILFSLALNRKVVIKVNVEEEQPKVPSVCTLWEAASWYERETHDLFGVEFEGNPNMKPLLLYEGFEGFPGRKSFPFHEYQEY